MSGIEIPKHRQAWSIYASEVPDFGDRNKVPSVSQLLAWAYGGPPDIPAVQVAMDRGSKVHFACQLLDEGDLHWPSVEGTDLAKYLDAWTEWTDGVSDFVAIEQPLYGTIAGIHYLVRPDRVMRKGKQTWVVDIKTKSAVGRPPTASEQRQHALEVAAQKLAVAQRLGPVADVVGCCYLWPDKAKFVRYGADKDVDDFADILFRWTERNEVAVA